MIFFFVVELFLQVFSTGIQDEKKGREKDLKMGLVKEPYCKSTAAQTRDTNLFSCRSTLVRSATSL